MNATSTKKTDSLCMDCDRIVGCPWMQLHRPVPGWTAVKTYLIVPVDGSLRRGDARVRLDTSYHVIRCPIAIPFPEEKMQQLRQGIKEYTHRGVTTYRVRCSFCGEKMPKIFDTKDAAEYALELYGWAAITGGAVMCPGCQEKRRRS